MERQKDFKPGTAQGSIADAYLASDARHDAFDDCQSEPKAGAVTNADTHTALKDALAKLGRNAGSVVIDAQSREWTTSP